MITKEFQSERTMDNINVNCHPKSHRAYVMIKLFDDVYENIKLLGDAIEFMKLTDIKWVVIKINGEPIVPKNTVWYENKKTNDINCHIEDFEKFYLANLKNIVTINIVYVSKNKKDDDGWICMSKDKNKLRSIKYNQLNTEIDGLATDWTSL